MDWKKIAIEVAKFLLAALAGLGGASVSAGCSVIGHADNVYEQSAMEGTK